MALSIAIKLQGRRRPRPWAWPRPDPVHPLLFASQVPGGRLGDTTSISDAQAVQAFQDLFARYQKPIADFLYRMTRDSELAADLTQDTFLKAYAHLSEIDSITNVRAWLYKIAANTARNALRRQHHFGWVSLADLQPAEAGDIKGVVLTEQGDLATSVVERDVLQSALLKLTPTARAVMLLRATGGFEIGEIATMLHISEANARKILYRAKEKLRAILTAQDAEQGGRR